MVFLTSFSVIFRFASLDIVTLTDKVNTIFNKIPSYHQYYKSFIMNQMKKYFIWFWNIQNKILSLPPLLQMAR